MSEPNDISSIADASKPNPGRVYDYFLGGNHNFEVDRLSAQRILAIAPFFPTFARLLRWFLSEAVRRLSAEGYTNFLDLASGLPTMDHIHHVAGPNAKVVYSDLDPITVAYGQEIVKELPNVRYIQCDASRPESLLESEAVAELFSGDRRVVIGMNAIAFFLADEGLEHSLATLYDWSGEGSRLFISDTDHAVVTETSEKIHELYKQMGQTLSYRSQKDLERIVGRWTISSPGFRPLHEWLDLQNQARANLTSEYGISGFYGGILEK